MSTRIRFRTDSSIIAEDKSVGKTFEQCWYEGCWFDREAWDAVPVAEPGDTWRIRWHKQDAEGNAVEGPIAGYAIRCPGCKEVHRWTTAVNCSSRAERGRSCAHSGVGSCWTWSGSAEDGTLTATPSLHALADRGACGWHGWLTNGELKSC